MSINLIAAISLTDQLGYKGNLLVHLPDDLKYFKEKTQSNICVFGRKTFQSVGKLPNRHNIILSHKKNLDVPSGVLVYNSVNEILRQYELNSNKEVELYICGGEEVYKQFLPHCDKLYITIINTIFDKADTFLPKFSLNDWEPVSKVYHQKDEQHEFDFHFVEYEKRNKLI